MMRMMLDMHATRAHDAGMTNTNPLPMGQPIPGTSGDSQHCVQCFGVVTLTMRPCWDRYGWYHPQCWEHAERVTASADGRLSI